MQPSVFTKIINGEISCHKIYEDNLTFVFLDVRPICPGHTLVVPKRQVDHIEELPDDIYQAVWAIAKKIARQQIKILGCKRVAFLVEGSGVPHAHIHLIPFNTSKDLHFDYLGVGSMANKKDLQAMAVKLKMGSTIR